MSAVQYERYKLCDELDPSVVCVVVEQYSEGSFVRKFHSHVPKSKLTTGARANLLKALVLHFAGTGPETIVRAYVRRYQRDKGLGDLPFFTSYPEPGVRRTYCGANTKAWIDQVDIAGDFRPAVA